MSIFTNLIKTTNFKIIVVCKKTISMSYRIYVYMHIQQLNGKEFIIINE